MKFPKEKIRNTDNLQRWQRENKLRTRITIVTLPMKLKTSRRTKILERWMQEIIPARKKANLNEYYTFIFLMDFFRFCAIVFHSMFFPVRRRKNVFCISAFSPIRAKSSRRTPIEHCVERAAIHNTSCCPFFYRYLWLNNSTKPGTRKCNYWLRASIFQR